MSYRIVCDSCTDVPEELKQDEHIKIVPLTLLVGNESIVDDDTFCQTEFLAKMKASAECPKSSCPSPESYMQYFEGEEDIYVVTLSSALSGSYNSATLAKKLYLEEHPSKNIEVIDSKTASVGQTLIVLKIIELAKQGKSFEEIVPQVLNYRDHLGTKFVLESLDNLRKNGRLSNLKAMIASALNIKPVMGATKEGTITKVDQGRGMKKALHLMVKAIEEDAGNPKDKVLGIAHCNNVERAKVVKQEILSRLNFKEVFIVDTAGVSSLYANDGGIVVCY